MIDNSNIRRSNRWYLLSVEGIKKANTMPEGLKPLHDVLGYGDTVLLQDVGIEIVIRTGNELKEWIAKNNIQ
jgi:hypothetical protein